MLRRGVNFLRQNHNDNNVTVLHAKLLTIGLLAGYTATTLKNTMQMRPPYQPCHNTMQAPPCLKEFRAFMKVCPSDKTLDGQCETMLLNLLLCLEVNQFKT
jgi:hypothetical protein